MDRQEIERLDDLGLKAWDEHDPDALLALFADSFVWEDLTLPEPMTTADEVRQYMTSWFTAFPDMRARATHRVVGEDGAGVELEFTGTNTGPLDMGGATIPPTGKSVVGRGSYFVQLNSDGKVSRFSSHPDVAGLMVQLGLMPMGSQAPTA